MTRLANWAAVFGGMLWDTRDPRTAAGIATGSTLLRLPTDGGSTGRRKATRSCRCWGLLRTPSASCRVRLTPDPDDPTDLGTSMLVNSAEAAGALSVDFVAQHMKIPPPPVTIEHVEFVPRPFEPAAVPDLVSAEGWAAARSAADRATSAWDRLVAVEPETPPQAADDVLVESLDLGRNRLIALAQHSQKLVDLAPDAPPPDQTVQAARDRAAANLEHIGQDAAVLAQEMNRLRLEPNPDQLRDQLLSHLINAGELAVEVATGVVTGEGEAWIGWRPPRPGRPVVACRGQRGRRSGHLHESWILG
jgi:hypothetical protein